MFYDCHFVHFCDLLWPPILRLPPTTDYRSPTTDVPALRGEIDCGLHAEGTEIHEKQKKLSADAADYRKTLFACAPRLPYKLSRRARIISHKDALSMSIDSA